MTWLQKNIRATHDRMVLRLISMDGRATKTVRNQRAIFRNDDDSDNDDFNYGNDDNDDDDDGNNNDNDDIDNVDIEDDIDNNLLLRIIRVSEYVWRKYLL